MSEQIIVLGGGVIGLSCALELRLRGHQVTVLEKQLCGGQASGAAAGMLAPYSENVEGPDPFFQLCHSSLRKYPAWQQQVKELSGKAFEYSETGSLYAVYHEADYLVLEGRKRWQREWGATAEIVEGERLRELEPLLSSEVRAALYTPEESHVYAPDYVLALQEACIKLGVRLEERLGHVSIATCSAQEQVLESENGRSFVSQRLVVCSGAWAQEQAEALGIHLPIYPIRGQICAYATQEVFPVRHMVFTSQGYVVGKANGTLVCGASEDVAGFDTRVTTHGMERLKGWNKRLLPYLAEQPSVHEWAGLRPATQDGFPLLGSLPHIPSVVLAVGHYRNGILLSPATAGVIADVIDGVSLPAYMGAFAPERFS